MTFKSNHCNLLTGLFVLLLVFSTILPAATNTQQNIQSAGTTFALSPDGHTLAAVNESGLITLLNLTNGEEQAHLLNNSTNLITAIAFSPDSQSLATTNSDTLTLWNVQSGEQTSTIPMQSQDAVRNLTFSPNGENLAGIAGQSAIKVWNVSSGSQQWLFQTATTSVNEIAFSPESDLLASSGNDGQLKIWDINTGQNIASMTNTSATAFTNLTFNSTGILAAIDADGNISLWDPAFAYQQQILADPQASTKVFVFTPNATKLASSSLNTQLNIWDLSALPSQPPTNLGNAAAILAFNTDGQLLASAATDNSISLWNITTGVLQNTLVGHQDQVAAMAFNTNNQTLTSIGSDGKIFIWALDTGYDIFDGQLALLGEIENTAATNPPSSTAIAGSAEAAIAIDAVPSTSQLTSSSTADNLTAASNLPKNWKGVLSIDASTEGKTYAGAYEDGTIHVWNDLGEKIAVLAGHNGKSATGVAFVTNKTTLVSSGKDSEIRVWNTKDWQPKAVMQGQGQPARSVTSSPNGRFIASCDESTRVMIWDANNGKLLTIAYGPISFVNTVAFSPSSKRLAAASDDGRIYIWDISKKGDFTLVHTLLGHRGAVFSLAFSINGKFLFSGGEDTKIRVWDLQTGFQTKFMQGHNGGIRALAASPNGKDLISSGEDTRLLVWDVQTLTLKDSLASNPSIVNTLKYRIPGKLLVGDENAQITEWDVPAKKIIRISKPSPKRILLQTSSTRDSTATKTLAPLSGPDSARKKLSTLFIKALNWLVPIAAAAPLPDPNQGPDGPILVIKDPSVSSFASFYAEILRNEGFNAFNVADIGNVTSAMLNNYDIVILGEMTLTTAMLTDITDWVEAGGNLIAMRPDPQLYGLLGILPEPQLLEVPESTVSVNTLADGYLMVDTSQPVGNGITGQTMQFHGIADHFILNGATELARIYSDAMTATSYPAATLNSVGNNGGQAAAFSYDLATSIVYTRQGNPAWTAQERDGLAPQRPNDRFYGNAIGDPQPDWVDLKKVTIPQADEQQRLLANLLIKMNMNKKPLPRFWYFPRGKKAVLIMTGDDHANEGSWGRFAQLENASPADCSVADWECLRGTSYLYHNTEELIPGQAADYTAKGFEVALHLNTLCSNYTDAELDAFYLQQINLFTARYPNIPAPVTQRNHCIAWSGWAVSPKVLVNHGIRFDTNYYYYPPSWVANVPGFMTGSGMPMRFADLDGTLIDVYQSATHMNDETGQQYPFTIDTLLNRALGGEGYYGAFNINAHTDIAVTPESTAVIQSALAHNVPVVSSLQMLNWLDGRNSSTFAAINWNGNSLSFTVTQGTGATGLQAHIPMHSNAGVLSSITQGGSSIPFTQKNIKGIDYAVLQVTGNTYTATYNVETIPPSVVAFSPDNNTVEVSLTANITAEFSEAMDVTTINSSTFELRDINNILVPAKITYLPGSRTAVLNPMAALRPTTLYTATIKGGQIKDLSGNALAADTTFSFTSEQGTECPCSVWEESTTPANPNWPDPNAVEIGVRFKSDIDGFITGIRFYKGADNTGPHFGNLWTSSGQLLASAFFFTETDTGWQQVDFTTPVPVTADTVYIASYYAPNGHYAAENSFFANSGVTNAPLELLQNKAGNTNGVYAYGPESSFPSVSYQATNYWVDVVFTTCPCSLWDEATTPSMISANDNQAVELGVKFQSQMDGHITGLKFYKSAANTGTHIGSLWENNGTLLAQATFTNETASGWQTVKFSTPIAISAGMIYIASYHSEVGNYSIDKNFFKLSGFDNGPLSALQNQVNEKNGVFLYGPGGFPVNSWEESNYWVDVIFTKN
jgi:WD40 repeat protein